LVFFAWYGVSKYDEHVIKQESILFNAYIQNKDKKSATTQLKHLKDANTVYSVFASLFYAKQLFDKKKYAKAEEELKYVIKNTTNNLWKDNAYIYLASVYWQQNNPKKGIETLNMINEMNSYSYELRGDMYSELNNKKQALTNYQQAIDLNKENRIPDDDLVMKINNT
jgi:predicted negative regulator of RcsB-dependent stress response